VKDGEAKEMASSGTIVSEEIVAGRAKSCGLLRKVVNAACRSEEAEGGQ
jgi:hypothetical protein